MKSIQHSVSAALLAWVTCVGSAASSAAAEGENQFSRTSLDVGLVVRDVEGAVKFYTNAIGFRETRPFSMSSELAQRVGFPAETLDVRVLVLEEERTATRLKLIGLPRREVATPSGLPHPAGPGFRYVTIFVGNIDQALERLKEAGVELTQGVVRQGEDSARNVYVLFVRDPEGNLIELVGPRGDASPSEQVPQ